MKKSNWKTAVKGHCPKACAIVVAALLALILSALLNIGMFAPQAHARCSYITQANLTPCQEAALSQDTCVYHEFICKEHKCEWGACCTKLSNIEYTGHWGKNWKLLGYTKGASFLDLQVMRRDLRGSRFLTFACPHYPGKHDGQWATAL